MMTTSQERSALVLYVVPIGRQQHLQHLSNYHT